jgi:hypothetical protein
LRALDLDTAERISFCHVGEYALAATVEQVEADGGFHRFFLVVAGEAGDDLAGLSRCRTINLSAR